MTTTGRVGPGADSFLKAAADPERTMSPLPAALRRLRLRRGRGATGLQAGTPWSRQRGAVAVEFALMAVLLVPLAYGLIDYGMLWQKRQTVDAATRVCG